MNVLCSCGEDTQISISEYLTDDNYIIRCKKCDALYEINKKGCKALSIADMMRLLLVR